MGYLPRTARLAPLALAALLTPMTAGGAEPGRALGRWVGQDGHDYCGAKDAIKPNGYQDVHILLGGLPPRREVAAAWITGHGSGEWQYRGVQNNYGAVLVRRPGSPTADLYFEPDRVETGRPFVVRLKFDDGSEAVADVRGGRANPDLRVPSEAMSARWVGQERQDHTGLGPCVGPDRLCDARIDLSRLDPKEKVVAVLAQTAKGVRWASGPNPEGFHNAEFVPDAKAPGEGSLFFQPDRNLAGQALKVTVAYENGKKDSATLTAGRTDPARALPPAPLPNVTPLTLTATWLGQGAPGATGPGEVRVRVAGLTRARGVAAAVLSDSVRGVWAYRATDRVPVDVEDGALPLGFRAATDRTGAELAFQPVRDETGATLTLRLVYADGSSAVGSFPGGACDPARCAPALDPSEAVARPGDDLAALVNRHGTVRLAKGNHALNRPLVLSKPVTLAGEPGAVLTFTQAANDAPWSAAIKIHAGNTTLRDFAVRFSGPVRWRQETNWGPAVIGTTDNFDNVPSPPQVNVVVSGLDIEGPGKSGSAPWEEAPRLVRLVGATCGRVVKNTLRGGLVHLFGGPWTVEDNDYRGTPPGTYSHSVFVVHEPHDVTVRNNRAKPVGPSGKTWRFLIFVQRGNGERVEGNAIEGIGPRDDDTIPPANAPEIILTESYGLFFEGTPAAVSADGRLVRIDRVRWVPARTGDVVSVLSGKGAGQWRRVAQRLAPDLYLLETPLPKGAGAVSVGPGFVNEVYEKNTIDAPRGGPAAGFILAGNHFGTVVRGNRVSGAGHAFEVMASATENPVTWGWSHAPVLGLVFEGNTVEDSEGGAIFGVSHGGLCKSNRGRVYLTAALRGNAVRWTDGFLSRPPRPGLKRPAAGVTLGYAPSIDPGELVVEERDNRGEAPARAAGRPALVVHAAVVNGRPVTNRSSALAPRRPPAGPAGDRAAGAEARPRR